MAEKRSRRTVVKNYHTLRLIMQSAQEQGYISQSPCANFKLPDAPRAAYDPLTGEFLSEQKPDVTTLDRNEITKLAAAMPDESYRVAVIFAAWMGLRAGEMWGLQRRDVDLLHGIVKVRRAWKEVNGKHRATTAPRTFLGPLKTRAARRDIHMPGFIAQMMQAHLAANPGEPDGSSSRRPRACLSGTACSTTGCSSRPSRRSCRTSHTCASTTCGTRRPRSSLP
jgi:integrase